MNILTIPIPHQTDYALAIYIKCPDCLSIIYTMPLSDAHYMFPNVESRIDCKHCHRDVYCTKYFDLVSGEYYLRIQPSEEYYTMEKID